MSRVICKLSFIAPGLAVLKVKNLKHLKYIVTRPGVDKSITDKEMGIKIDNLNWVVAMHREEKHPHVHIMIWENSPERICEVLAKKV